MSQHDDISGQLGFTPGLPPGAPQGSLAGTLNISGDAAGLLRQAAGGPHEVTLQRAAVAPTPDQLLWTAIRNRTEAIAFPRYHAFIRRLLCERAETGSATCGGGQAAAGSFALPSIDERFDELMSRPGIYGLDAYGLLKLATQAFLLYEGGVSIHLPRGAGAADAALIEQEEALRLGRPITLAEARAQLEAYLSTQVGGIGGRGLPYLKRVVDALLPEGQRQEGSPFCEHTLRHRLSCPAMMELIRNYWLEQGGVMQTVNAVLLRFQNRRRGRGDPLANLAIDPLRGASTLFWGRVQAEPQQLSLRRREHEYTYAYDMKLRGGEAAEDADLDVVERRSHFVRAFHDLLYETARFYEADAVTTVRADAFGLLQRLKELHLVLAEAANNQWPEITRQAREELLIDQYLLARPEIREFLRGRAMVPAAELWMPTVDAMKRLQGWMPDIGVGHFDTLSRTGEQLLLSVRFGDWTDARNHESAIQWARYWMAEVRGYLHAYQVATGVDLAAEVGAVRDAGERYLQPAEHLHRRLLPRAAPAALAFESAELPTIERAEGPGERARLRALMHGTRRDR